MENNFWINFLNYIKGIIHEMNIDANIIKFCHAVTFLGKKKKSTGNIVKS